MDEVIDHIVELAGLLTAEKGEELLQRLELKLIGFSDEQIEKEIRGDAPLLLRETLSTAAERASEKAFAEIWRALERAQLSEMRLEQLLARVEEAYGIRDEDETDRVVPGRFKRWGDAESEVAWKKELQQRSRDLASGLLEEIPFEQVMAELAAKYEK